MPRATRRERLRYAFDNYMARGTGALIVALFVITLVAVIGVVTVFYAVHLYHADSSDVDFFQALWLGLLSSLDAGQIGNDSGSSGFLGTMLVVTLGGIFVVAILIGIVNNGIEGKLAELRQGHSRVLESDHTVILGWSQQVFTILAELVEANANQRHACVVILAEHDKVDMEEQIRTRLPHRTDARASSAAAATPWTSTRSTSPTCRPRGPSSCSRRRATTRTWPSSRRCWPSPTTPTVGRSRTTWWPRCATRATWRSRRWSARTRSSWSWWATSSPASPRRPAGSRASRWSTPSCSTSAVTRSTSPSSPA